MVSNFSRQCHRSTSATMRLEASQKSSSGLSTERWMVLSVEQFLLGFTISLLSSPTEHQSVPVKPRDISPKLSGSINIDVGTP